MKTNKLVLMAGLLAASIATGAIASPQLNGTLFTFLFTTPAGTHDYTTYSNMRITVDPNSPMPGYIVAPTFVNQVTLTPQNPSQWDGGGTRSKVTPQVGDGVYTGILDLTLTPTMGGVTFSPITFQMDFSKTGPVTQNIPLSGGAVCQGVFGLGGNGYIASLAVSCLD